MAQHTLSVFQRPVLLHVGSQGAPHHLKRDEVIRDAELLGSGANSPLEEVFAPARHRLPLAFPAPKGGEHQGFRRRIIADVAPRLKPK